MSKIIDVTLEFINTNLWFIVEKIDLSIFSLETVIFDILFVSIFFYYIITWIIKSKIWKFLIFTISLSAVYLISILFKFQALKILMWILFLFLLITLPIIYQNEIRKGIESFWLFSIKRKYDEKTKHRVIKEVKHAAEILSRKKIWALIVFERKIDLTNYCVTWIVLNAKLSKELLINIFMHKSPLHDWAAIVKDDIILSAWSVLPLSHNVTDIRYWTRHKSAIWISELTDSVVIVVSEERWEISYVKEWEIWSNVTLDEIEKFLFDEKI